jgi:hypothetical protein
VHRVVTPPADQLNVPRLGLLYFSRPGDDKDPNQQVVKGIEYVRARVKDVHHKTVLTKREGTSFEFKGLKVANHYE